MRMQLKHSTLYSVLSALLPRQHPCPQDKNVRVSSASITRASIHARTKIRTSVTSAPTAQSIHICLTRTFRSRHAHQDWRLSFDTASHWTRCDKESIRALGKGFSIPNDLSKKLDPKLIYQVYCTTYTRNPLGLPSSGNLAFHSCCSF